MTANELIEAYVTDIAVQLPRRLRNDVAFELRALLKEELQARAGDAGRDADAAMTLALLREFGRPTDVAARYRPTLTIIDPVDGHGFLRNTLIGVAVIWVGGLALVMHGAHEASVHWLSALGRWWTGIAIPSLWWPGVLVVGYGLAAWSRQHRPQHSEWTPRTGDASHANRKALALGVVGIALGVFLLANPGVLLDLFLQGHAAPAAYQVLAYTDDFREHRAAWMFGAQLLYIPILLAVIVRGYWTAAMRRAEIVVVLASCAVMIWCLLAGPVFANALTDRIFKAALVLTVAWMLIDLGLRWMWRVRPAPVT